MRILVIVEPARFDFYNYLSKEDTYEYILLWHEKASKMDLPLASLPLKFTKVIFWNDYISPRKLLSEIKPDKIIFFEIIDLRQIALIVTGNKLRITTFYLEHGAAGDREAAITLWWDKKLYKEYKLPYFSKRIKTGFKDIIRSKIFYYSVTKGFNSLASYIKYLKLPFVMLRMLPNKALAYNKFPERTPAYSIIFNEINFEQFELYTGIPRSKALFTGVPAFDKFYTADCKEEEHLVYIDHPYYEERMLNWNKDHHRMIAEKLFAFAELNNIKLYVKLHPVSNRKNWEQYSFNKQYIEILQNGDFNDLYLKSKLILGFSSSLMTGFLCARKNIVLLGWHPQPHIFGVDFSKTGICHLSFSPDDLENNYSYWVNNNLTLENNGLYMNFLKKFNSPFDGQARERIIGLINKL